MKHYQYFQNRNCEFFPCHSGTEDFFNCLFCYCPLYHLGKHCGGRYTILENGIKSCEHCTLPHRPGGYEWVLKQLQKESY